jgi:hypothetical protein
MNERDKTITIEARSYERSFDKRRMNFIHRYYLPRMYREKLTPADIAAIDSFMLQERKVGESLSSFSELFRGKDCCIHYIKEELTKKLTDESFIAGMTACDLYEEDCRKRVDLTDEDSNYLIKFNEQLRTFEYELRKELAAIDNELQRELEAGALFVQDYEIEAIINFILAEDDPWSEDNDDNILYEYVYCWNPKHRKAEDLFAGVDGWNDKRGATYSNLPIWQVPHCWLFHELEDHSPVPVQYLNRIGMIWTDIHSLKQSFTHVNRGKVLFTK